MKRPEQHVTDSRGQTQLRGALEPLGWTLSIVADYGTDFDVEVFEKNKSTGITFKIQLKSSLAADYSADGSYISQPLDVKNARYLIHEMQTPTILVHADVENGRPSRSRGQDRPAASTPLRTSRVPSAGISTVHTP